MAKIKVVVCADGFTYPRGVRRGRNDVIEMSEMAARACISTGQVREYQ